MQVTFGNVAIRGSRGVAKEIEVNTAYGFPAYKGSLVLPCNENGWRLVYLGIEEPLKDVSYQTLGEAKTAARKFFASR